MEPQKKDAKGAQSTELKEFLTAFEKVSAKPGARWVLIVDDEPAVLRVVSRSMSMLDPELKVHQAENGREALELLKSLRRTNACDPVLIVTDLQMPVMDGWEFIDNLTKEYEEKGRTSGIPLIVLSSSSGEKGFFTTKSVHGSKCRYMPLVSVAKEDCAKPMRYDAQGEKGLIAWIRHFLD